MRPDPEPSVLWREGTFLCPQHMQAFSRELHSRISHLSSLGMVGAHGLRRMSINEAALARGTFQLEGAEAIFPDGTVAVFPQNAAVEERSFTDFFTAAELDVHLGVPAARPNVPQVSEDAAVHPRYRVRSRSVHDENLRDAPNEVEFRELQGRLFFGDEDRAGFVTLPLARLVRRGTPEPVTTTSEVFVPPAVALGASPVLCRLLRELAAEARGHARDLASRIPATAALSSAAKGADLAGFVKLQAVNRSVASLEQISHALDLHPFDAYMWLVQTIGNLAIFGKDRVMPELAPYDPEHPGESFDEAQSAIRDLLAADVALPYDRASFQADPTRNGFFTCEIPADWKRFQPKYFVGIEIAKTPEEVIPLVAGGVKLISAGNVERVLRGVVPGIGLAFERNPPLAFPKREHLHFFRVETEGAGRDDWLEVQKASGALLLSTLSAVGEARYHFYVELKNA